MIIFKTPIILAMLAILIGLHIASLLVSEKVGKILTYVNIGLHILLLPLLLLQKFTIEEGVLCYMISVFAYTLASYIVYKKRSSDNASQKENTTAPEGADTKASLSREGDILLLSKASLSREGDRIAVEGVPVEGADTKASPGAEALDRKEDGGTKE